MANKKTKKQRTTYKTQHRNLKIGQHTHTPLPPPHDNMAAINSLEEFEDTKGVIRIRKLKKDRQHNVQNKKDKRANNDLQNITQKTKDRVTRTPQTTSYISILKPTIDIRCC